MLSTATAYVLAILVLLTVIRCAFGARRISGIPYHRVLWWLPTGNLIELAIHFLLTGEVFDWIAHQNIRSKSPIVQLFLPTFSLTKPVLLISDLREIEIIATKRVRDVDRSSLMHGFFRLFADHATIGTKTWETADIGSRSHTFKQQRRLWNCMVTPRMLEQIVAPAQHRAIERMVELWTTKSSATPGYAFMVDLDLRQAALEGMWEMLTGTPLDLLKRVEHSVQNSTNRDISTNLRQGKAVFQRSVEYPPLYKALERIFLCLDWVTTGFSPPFYAWVFENSGILAAATTLKDETLNNVINSARASVASKPMVSGITSGYVLEEVLLRGADLSNEKMPSVTNAALRDELMELLITGHETTSAATGWALKYLADHQDVQQRLLDHLLAAFPNASQGSLPSARELMKADLPYLDAVIAEVLRVSATGPVSFRETIQDCDILGHQVEAGTQLILVLGGPSYHTSGDRKLFVPDTSNLETADCEKNPTWSLKTFQPARWMTSEGKYNPHAVPSLPFSCGPRGCFGKKIALLGIRTMVSMVVLNFQLPQLPSSLSKYNSRDSLTRNPTCCYVRPEMRNKSATGSGWTYL